MKTTAAPVRPDASRLRSDAERLRTQAEALRVRTKRVRSVVEANRDAYVGSRRSYETLIKRLRLRLALVGTQNGVVATPPLEFMLAREDPVVREELAAMYLPLVKQIASKFTGRGEPLDDLVQVGSVALMKALGGFDPDRGAPFSVYAAAMISGEIKHHFRDTAWSVHVIRRLQESGLLVTRVTDRLQQELGRAPTIGELSRESGLSEGQVVEAMEAGRSYKAVSLDTPAVMSARGQVDPGMDLVEQLADLGPALRKLSQDERKLLSLRFHHDLSQHEIASRLGVSQMQVSLLLARTIERLRDG
ncbi:MAG TPA: sigma-70 family RNA polymerase sigma factor, partial [Actinomycetota bacterium]|nr:sigma-70 family RNA polymerase sigma factor [Actinomycetota bacterium]